MSEVSRDATKADIEATLSVLDGIGTMFTRSAQPGTDILLTGTINTHRRSAVEKAERRKEGYKKLISDLMTKSKELKQRSENPPSRVQLKQQDVLRAQIEEAEATNEAYQEQIEEHERAVENLAQRLERLDVEKKEAESRSMNELPVLEAKLNLMTHITDITLNTGGPSNEIRGVVHAMETGELRRFALDKDKLTPTQIANALWDTAWELHYTLPPHQPQ